jgi:hypothetical protein
MKAITTLAPHREVQIVALSEPAVPGFGESAARLGVGSNLGLFARLGLGIAEYAR